ncbi:MAG: ATP-binding protein [Planctomycetota bacterium]|nr:ATP-binding protein [Planctomycetota bacterium]
MSSDNRTPHSEPRALPGTAAARVFRVLLVEDSPTDQQLVKHMLSMVPGLNVDVTVAETLADCIAQLQRSEFDGLLLDLSLPDSTRLASCDRIVEHFPNMPFVVLMGLEDREIGLAAVQRGAQDFLSKRKIDGELIARTLQNAVERKRISQALRDSELRYRALLKAMTSMVWQADARGNFDGDNVDWMAYTSQSKSLAAGDGWLYVFHAEDAARMDREWKAACENATEFETSARLWNVASQSYREVELRAVPLLGDDRKVREWIGQLTDVEDARRTELEMRRTQRLASVGTLAAGIAHEVNNPLGAAQISAQAALANLEANPDRVGECLENVVASLDRCVTIMDNILQFVRTGTGASLRQRLDVIVNHAISLSKGYAAKHNARLSAQTTDPPPLATVNAIEIEQVLLNLIRNAIHSRDGGVNVLVRSELGENGNARLIVHDDGCGIPSEIRDRILDPFFTTRKAGSGTGLGLSIVHGIVREHGGKIEFESVEDGGTTFIVEFPR